MIISKKDISKEGMISIDVGKVFHKKTRLYYINETKIQKKNCNVVVRVKQDKKAKWVTMASKEIEISDYGLPIYMDEEHILDISFTANKRMALHQIFTDVKLENKI